MTKELYNYRKINKIFICFSGPVTQNFLVETLNTLNHMMELENIDRTRIKRVYSVLVELVQNIIHYSAEKMPEGIPSTLSVGTIAVGSDNGHFFIFCENMIESTKSHDLLKRLTELQKMSPAELKDYYKKQIRTNPGSDSKGAGLGFIEIARKSLKPIEFHVNNIDEKYSLFSLTAVV